MEVSLGALAALAVGPRHPVLNWRPAGLGGGATLSSAMTDVALLEREMYAEAEAARLLDVAQSTLHYWLEGKTGRGGKVHRPVIRVEPKGAGAAVTWAEFVEAGLLRQYGRELKVPLPELRAFIDLLRERFDVPYPLADRRPYASGKALVPVEGPLGSLGDRVDLRWGSDVGHHLG